MLRPGARIAVVSPSAVYEPARLEAGIATIAGWGYEPVRGPHLGRTHRYLAGTNQERAEDLRWALESDDVDAVWFARGGYGTIHCLDAIDWDATRDRPVIGFSDATALFSAMRGEERGIAVHGPVLHSLADHADEASRARIRALLAGDPVPRLAGRTLVGPEQFRVSGPLVGGNLCVLASLCGTPWALEAAGAIVLLEEIAEPPYKVDRLLTQLVASGALEGVHGFALGTFLGADAPKGADWSVADVVAEVLGPLGVPIVHGMPIGHGPENHAVLLHRSVTLTPDGLDVGGG
jgi:muramoyltetrapeptide carboxypeptidase